MSEASVSPAWRTLVKPRWIGWHLFAVAAVVGMFWLGDWQFRRAMAGNTLSWAYTFEWPIFAVFGVVFWIKTVRDELHPQADARGPAPEIALPGGASRASAGIAGDGQVTAPDGTSYASADGTSQDGAARGPDDTELAEYNAYLAKLSSQVKGHGRWHGLR